MEGIKKVINTTQDHIEDFETIIDEMMGELKTSIELHFSNLDIVKQMNKDKNLSSVVLFDIANDFGTLFSGNLFRDTDNRLCDLEMYSDELFDIIEKEANKVKEYIDSKIELNKIFYSGQGIVLVLTEDGLIWENYDL